VFRSDDVLALQRVVGNRSVSSMLHAKVAGVPGADAAESQQEAEEGAQGPGPGQPVTRTYTDVVSYNLSARIPRRGDSDASAAPVSPVETQSARRTASSDMDSAEQGAEAEQVKEKEGEVEIVEGDTVAPGLLYSPSIGARATPPNASQFGVTSTRPTVPAATINIVHDAAAAEFNVRATVNNSVTWAVHSLGRTDILDEDAAAITAANYTTAASDLTPNMASDGGRPPRTQFWASDLTAQHEQFHANERATTYGMPAFEFAQTWLGTQTAADEAEVRTHVNQVPAKMHENYATAYTPGKETRAYGNGAPAYRARADAITAKGTSGGYGAAAPP
jgi:hypothetical protein